ncbi:hypothetical protein DFJ58DRAFT_847084 [Suillus subalutaceus]|uniref:uncharacterized protein n=1 Tax=Suillus subalutaceus TaxID=48586 RepID=UPI001B877698|nr:uncharacterized protein DFJ58DRAFT_847084 [Suillus subalutaceus]KAG1836199.1 hypothetical protein DFJ58DRAFT_847084 [Suillus subalutaceus]
MVEDVLSLAVELCVQGEHRVVQTLKYWTVKARIQGDERKPWTSSICPMSGIHCKIGARNWQELKLSEKHSNAHVFDDILAKGATRNYNTKPNERMHGPLRAIYLWQTNFKNVTTQVLRYDHWLLMSMSMHSEVDDLDEYTRQKVVDPEAARQPVFSQIEQEHAADTAFSGFRVRLNNFLNKFLPQHGIPLPDGRRVHFRADD